MCQLWALNVVINRRFLPLLFCDQFFKMAAVRRLGFLKVGNLTEGDTAIHRRVTALLVRTRCVTL